MSAAEEAPAPDKAVVAAVADFCSQLKRTLLAYRLYGETHEQGVHHEGISHAKLKVLTQQMEEVVLDVVGESLCFQGQRVLHDEDRQDLVVGALAVDGITQLSFTDGITRDQLSKLFRRWNMGMRGRFDSDYSMSTALWEDELEDVHLVVRDVIGEEDQDDGTAAGSERADLAGRVRALLKGLRTDQTSAAASLRVAPAALAALAKRTSIGLLSSEELKARSDAERLSLRLVDAELTIVASALEAARKSAVPRAIYAMFLALTGTTGAERAELLVVARRLMVELLQADRFAELSRAVTRVIERATVDVVRRADIEDFMAGFADDAALDVLVRAVNDRIKRDASLALLQYLPRRELPALFRSLLKAEGDGRTALLDLATRKKPTPEQVFAVFDDDAVVAPELFRLARRISAELADALLRRGLADPRPGMPLQMLKRVKPQEVATFREIVRGLLDAKDDALRDEAVTLLARARDPAAVAHLQATVASTTAPIEQRKRAVSALVAFDDDAARAALRALFVLDTPVELRVGIAFGLAATNDVSAVPLLEAAAKPMFADRALKAACKSAIERLGKRSSSSGP